MLNALQQCAALHACSQPFESVLQPRLLGQPCRQSVQLPHKPAWRWSFVVFRSMHFTRNLFSMSVYQGAQLYSPMTGRRVLL